MPHNPNRVEAAEGKARGIGPSGAEHSPAQGATLGNRRPPARSHKCTNSRGRSTLRPYDRVCSREVAARCAPTTGSALERAQHAAPLQPGVFSGGRSTLRPLELVHISSIFIAEV